MTSPRRIRSTRLTALPLLFACLLSPLAASGDPCCAGMAAPCHEDPAPCATLDAASCCDVAPAAAPLAADRECNQAVQAACARSTSSLAAHPVMPAPLAPTPARVTSPPHRFVVLRN